MARSRGANCLNGDPGFTTAEPCGLGQINLHFSSYRRDWKTTYPQVSARLKLADNEGEHMVRNSPQRAEVDTDGGSDKHAMLGTETQSKD